MSSQYQRSPTQISSGVAAVSASAPLASSGGSSPNISLNGDVLTTPSEFVNPYTSNYWGGPGTFIGNNSDNDQTNQVVVLGSSDTSIAGNATSNVVVAAGDNTNAAATQAPGSLYLIAGSAPTGSANSGGITITSGASDTGNVGLIDITGGFSNSNPGGSIRLFTGVGSSRGSIKFQDGSEGTSGHVWTSTDTQGNGHWAPASGGGSPGGSDTQVQYNSSGSFAGDQNLTYIQATGTLSTAALDINDVVSAGTIINLYGDTNNANIDIENKPNGGGRDLNITTLQSSTQRAGGSISMRAGEAGAGSDSHGGLIQIVGGSGDSTSVSGNSAYGGDVSIVSGEGYGGGHSGNVNLVGQVSDGLGGVQGKIDASVARSMTLPLQPSAPTSKVEGDLYYDTGTHKAYVWDGTTWQALW